LRDAAQHRARSKGRFGKEHDEMLGNLGVHVLRFHKLRTLESVLKAIAAVAGKNLTP